MRFCRPRRGDLLPAFLGITVLAALLGRSPGTPSPATCPPAWPIPVNRASLDTLMLLPGLGPARAGRILEERDRRGPFLDGSDLARRLPDLGPAVHRAILPHLEFPGRPGAGL